MRRFAQSLAVFMAGGILLGICPFLSAADESKVTEKAVPAKSEKEIKPLIDQLGSERFKDREQAAHELAKLGKSALPGLKEAAKSPDAEVSRRAQQLVEQIEPPPVRSIDPQRQRLAPAVKNYL
jgi:HEAT repeat protein